jgi:muramoyltetrapeptide carboxypeptidase LdcA involved in peptidoglycan recycling
MRTALSVPPKLRPGDRVAVVSPSFAAPGAYPGQHEVAMRRLREDFELEPVEYPTTRRLGASPADRAADLQAAYADPAIRAVLATIGGDDQITVLAHLDPTPFRADPKPFLGYSDNTNLLNWLWYHGVAAYHGGSTMVHLARGGGLQPVHVDSLRAALFTGGDLEIMHWSLAANRWIRPVEDYAGCVLLLETSEEMPSAEEVFRMLRNAGERGLLQQFPAVLVGTAKATALGNARPPEDRPRYRDEQRAAILRALAEYHPDAMVVFGVDFGHTDPQWILPYGGRITVDGLGRRIIGHY